MVSSLKYYIRQFDLESIYLTISGELMMVNHQRDKSGYAIIGCTPLYTAPEDMDGTLQDLVKKFKGTPQLFTIFKQNMVYRILFIAYMLALGKYPYDLKQSHEGLVCLINSLDGKECELGNFFKHMHLNHLELDPNWSRRFSALLIKNLTVPLSQRMNFEEMLATKFFIKTKPEFEPQFLDAVFKACIEWERPKVRVPPTYVGNHGVFIDECRKVGRNIDAQVEETDEQFEKTDAQFDDTGAQLATRMQSSIPDDESNQIVKDYAEAHNGQQTCISNEEHMAKFVPKRSCVDETE